MRAPESTDVHCQLNWTNRVSWSTWSTCQWWVPLRPSAESTAANFERLVESTAVLSGIHSKIRRFEVFDSGIQCMQRNSLQRNLQKSGIDCNATALQRLLVDYAARFPNLPSTEFHCKNSKYPFGTVMKSLNLFHLCFNCSFDVNRKYLSLEPFMTNLHFLHQCWLSSEASRIDFWGVDFSKFFQIDFSNFFQIFFSNFSLGKKAKSHQQSGA